MPERLDAFPPKALKTMRKRGAYQYLTDGQIYRLVRGVDFPAEHTFATLRGRLSYVAARANMRQRTAMESADVIVVQLYRLEKGGA